MRMHALLLLGLLSATSSVAAEVPLERHSLGSWEADIGYAGVVRAGDTPHISGVACEGADMPVAVQTCYRELTGILQRFGADSSQVVKETLEALERKQPLVTPSLRYKAIYHATRIAPRFLVRAIVSKLPHA